MFLFLDRDGVINRRLPGAYVKDPSEFEFLPGVLDALRQLTSHFSRIFIVTNQQGIGKLFMSTEDLLLVHEWMLEEISTIGGRIDAIYYCPHLATANCDCRKPKVGMAFQAKKGFPEVDFSNSVLVGDSWSDLRMGSQLGMDLVWVDSKKEDEERIIKDWQSGLFPRLSRVNSLAEWVTLVLPR